MQMGPRREIWFLTGSQALYGQETLDQVAAQSRAVAEQLDDALGEQVTVVWRETLTTSDAIRRACLDATADDTCIGVIAWMHTFSPAKMWIAGLDQLRKPFLHLHTQANRSLPWATIDMDFMNLNQAAHGDREFGHIQSRMGIRRKIVAGHVSDPEVVTRIGSWVRAACGWQAMRTLRLARFGDSMRNVAVTDGDRVDAQARFGASVLAYGVNDLVDVVNEVDGSAIDEVVTDYLDEYVVAAHLRPGGERHESLRDAARIEVGLRHFLHDGGFTAFTTNFEDLGALKQLPGIAVQRLMSDGFGFGAEGDWKTSLLVRTVKVMGEGRPGGTSFIEDYTYHLGPGTPKILGAHMLEVCPSIAGGVPSCEVHPLAIGGREDPVRLVFDAQPGPGVVVGLTDLGDRFRITANDVDVVAPDEPLPSLPVARAVWVPRPNLTTSAEAWLLAGGSHHSAISLAIGRDELQDFAEIADTELVHIGADTTPTQLGKELRWNQAYYRLAARS